MNATTSDRRERVRNNLDNIEVYKQKSSTSILETAAHLLTVFLVLKRVKFELEKNRG